MARTAEELRTELQGKREAVSRDLDEIGDKVSPKRAAERAKGKVRRRAHDVKDAVVGSAEDLSHSATDAADRAGERMGDIRDTVSDAPQMVRQRTESNPFAAGLIAFGIGMLAASMIPRSRTEEQFVRRFEGELTEASAQVGDAAATVAGELRERSQEVVAGLRDDVSRAASEVGEQATEAAHEVKDTAVSQASGSQSTNQEPQWQQTGPASVET